MAIVESTRGAADFRAAKNPHWWASPACARRSIGTSGPMLPACSRLDRCPDRMHAMTQIPSFLLAAVVTYVISATTHGALGTAFGALVDLIVFFAVFYFTNRLLRKIRNG
jgi:hypothetical protein